MVFDFVLFTRKNFREVFIDIFIRPAVPTNSLFTLLLITKISHLMHVEVFLYVPAGGWDTLGSERSLSVCVSAFCSWMIGVWVPCDVTEGAGFLGWRPMAFISPMSLSSLQPVRFGLKNKNQFMRHVGVWKFETSFSESSCSVFRFLNKNRTFMFWRMRQKFLTKSEEKTLKLFF